MGKNIEIAIHIRTIDRSEDFNRFFRHLKTFYGTASFGMHSMENDVSPNITRLYIGDEFCPHRLPDMDALHDFSRFAQDNRLALTMLTPPLSDREIERHFSLFDYLNKFHNNVEIVVNDMGVILFLKKGFPLLRLVAGRLLNKAFKDPRLTDAAGLSSYSEEAEILLNECTFDNEVFQNMMAGFDIWRMEQDLLPYGNAVVDTISGMKRSVYFPFGYISSGRVCFSSTFNMPEASWFMPLDQCSRSCDLSALDLKNDNFAFQVIQSGNTVFYLYPKQRITDLFEKACQQEMRLVYQGFAI